MPRRIPPYFDQAALLAAGFDEFYAEEAALYGGEFEVEYEGEEGGEDEDPEDEYSEEEEEEEEERDVRVSEYAAVDGGVSQSAAAAEGGDERGKSAVVEEEEEEWSRSQIDGLFCPICMEAWSSSGNHQICCLPCGHIYGLSCIKKWLQKKKRDGKCPQCNKKCEMKDVRLLYASQLHVVDEGLQKKICSLEAKCSSLEKKCADWSKKEVGWKRKEADLQLQVRQLKERTNSDDLLREMHRRPSELYTSGYGCNSDRHGYFNCISLKEEIKVEGARFFDVDASCQILIMARRLSGMGATHVLTKMSLLSGHVKEDIQLKPNVKAVKDLRVSQYGGLVLVASLGKKLSVLSMDTNNTILQYDLPAAAWSCSWDANNAYYIYAGLQNGMVMEFDRRQTAKPVESMNGLAVKPIHTMHSVSRNPVPVSGLRRSILTASSVGLCHWDFGCGEERPHLIPESENQGVCISLAYASRANNIVASFRPKVEMSGDIPLSQSMFSPDCLTELPVLGSHVVYNLEGGSYRKVGASSANVSGIRLPKSTIIERCNQNPMFVCGDEATCELVLEELPSLTEAMRFQAPRNPVRDVKYSVVSNSGLLSCLRQDTVQLFSVSSS